MSGCRRIWRYCHACLLAALSGAVLSGGCASRSPSGRSGPVILRFWNGFTGPDGATMESIVKRFNAEHPGIRVSMQIIPWSTYYDKLTLGLAYGGAPDVFILHANRFPEFANYQALAPVDDLAQKDHLSEKDFAGKAWRACHWRGKLYGIPLDCHPIGLYYNTELFKQAGIVDERGQAKPPRTLQEFRETARRLTRDTNGDGRPDVWGFAFTWLRSNSYTFLDQFGTGLLDARMTRSDLDSPQAAEAISLMRAFIYKDRICPPPEGTDSWMGFQTGKVAMAMEGVYMLSSLESQKNLSFAAAPCPRFGPRMAVWAGSHLMVMPRDISRRTEQAAWTFIRYLSDNSLEWAKGGQVPVRLKVLNSAGFQKLTAQRRFSEELPYIEYEPPSVTFNQIAPFGDAAVEAALGRIKPPREALQEAARRINDVMERQ